AWLSPMPANRPPPEPFEVAEDTPSPTGGLRTLSGTSPGPVSRCVPLTPGPLEMSIRRVCVPEPEVRATLSRTKLCTGLPVGGPVDQLVESPIGAPPDNVASWKQWAGPPQAT